ncbi:MAG: PaaI family thioesterase [Pseudomonadota bacterium]
MEIHTHQRISRSLCGSPVAVGEGFSRVEMIALPEMVVDDSGLVHGGYVFGLADHAAMIAVNHPNVVLGGAECRFLKPVRVGESMTAEAAMEPSEGKKRLVSVTVSRGDEPVFTGTFTCFVLDKHVLG